MATSKNLESLIRRAQSPIFMTSANISGEPTGTNLDDIEKNCPLIDGMMEGNVVWGEASTIVDCSSDEIKILREGPISMEKIITVLNKK